MISHGANCKDSLGIYSGMGIGNSVSTDKLMLEMVVNNEFCFSVTASSDNNTVIVDGNLHVLTAGIAIKLFL